MLNQFRVHLVIIIALAALSFSFSSRAQAAEGNDCECPKLSCDADCETQTDLTFYSEKCASGEKVKSCARPTCVANEDAPASCKKPKMAKTDAAPAPVVDRQPAAAPLLIIGRVKFVDSDAWVTPANGPKAPLTVGIEIREKDRIATSANGKVQIEFTNGNKLNITPNSEVVINEASDAVPSAEKKRMVLDLIKGKIRNKVNVKYDGEQSYYQVKTRVAVAGVRGTEFVVSVDENEKNFISKIETLEGKVELSDISKAQKIYVAKNETASYVAERSSLSDIADVNTKIKGHMTDVSKMSDADVLDLNRVTLFEGPGSETKTVAKAKPAVQDEDMPICAAPSAQLNQCAWTCENNPKGEKKCRTDLTNVTCVRRICNANGKWSSPTRLPASFKESCKGSEPVVKACDY